jgi:hypothetical protein
MPMLVVDEKTGMQALDRTQSMLPLQAAKPRVETNGYVQHGDADALGLKLGYCHPEEPSLMCVRGAQQEFVGVSGVLGAKPIRTKGSNIVRDNPSALKHEAARKGLEARSVRELPIHFDPLFVATL